MLNTKRARIRARIALQAVTVAALFGALALSPANAVASPHVSGNVVAKVGVVKTAAAVKAATAVTLTPGLQTGGFNATTVTEPQRLMASILTQHEGWVCLLAGVYEPNGVEDETCLTPYGPDGLTNLNIAVSGSWQPYTINSWSISDAASLGELAFHRGSSRQNTRPSWDVFAPVSQ